MKKIPTMFVRDWNGDRSRVTREPNPACQWVFDGEGVATRKYDGACCMVRDGKLYKRRELGAKQSAPTDFFMVDHDEETGKTVGWVPVGDGPEDRWFREAFNDLAEGTYELLGPKVQGNVERLERHVLQAHSAAERYHDVPRTFDGLREWLHDRDIEGLVFHHPDGRMGKIKLRDFGMKRGGSSKPAATEAPR